MMTMRLAPFCFEPRYRGVDLGHRLIISGGVAAVKRPRHFRLRHQRAFVFQRAENAAIETARPRRPCRADRRCRTLGDWRRLPRRQNLAPAAARMTARRKALGRRSGANSCCHCRFCWANRGPIARRRRSSTIAGICAAPDQTLAPASSALTRTSIASTAAFRRHQSLRIARAHHHIGIGAPGFHR